MKLKLAATPKLDPDLFRRKVGQYGSRWYYDPLPSCDVADADDDWQAPSVSTIKNAAGKDWTQVSLQRVGQWITETKPTFEGLDAGQVSTRLQEASSAGLDLAAERGTQIHEMFEVYADGGDPGSVELGAAAMHYRRSVLKCIAEMKPVVSLSEFVCINRGVGYGGTADAIWYIDGEYWLVDYKTRAKKHATYLEELWQLAAYGNCEYAIGAHINDAGDIEHSRFELPELAGGLILSITPGGYRCYPVDLQAAWPGFQTLRTLWGCKASGQKDVRGKPWERPPMTRDSWIRDRIETIKDLDITPLLVVWPEGVPKPKQQGDTPYSDAEIELLIVAVEFAEKEVGAPWPEGDPDPPKIEQPEIPEAPVVVESVSVPEEGDEMLKALEVIRARFAKLSTTQVEWISARVVEAADAGMPIRVAERPTARRVFISRALILACERGITGNAFEAILASVGDELVEATIGERLGSLDWERASVLAGLVSMAHPRQPELDQPVGPGPLDPAWLENLKKEDLKQMCRDRSLKVGGTAKDLVQRLLDEQPDRT